MRRKRKAKKRKSPGMTKVMHQNYRVLDRDTRHSQKASWEKTDLL